ncbi:MAG TPA: response regulator [Acidimicrobiales bacterium]|nr:response regulator [Acidimicrobiales bacterium]
MQVSVTIGPVPTASAWAWIGAARETIAVLRARPELDVPIDVVDALAGFVDAFEAHARSHPDVFEWSEPVEAEVVRTLGLHWARIVSVTRSGRAPDLSTAPPEGEAFYGALATGIADALAAEDIGDAFAEAVPTFDAAPHQPPPATPMRVVVVDDQSDMRMLLRIWLEGDPGFEVVGEAANGRDALEVVRATRPDAVVLDLEMPGQSGLEALPHLLDAVPGLAVVVFSADDEIDAALAAGAAAFVSKGQSISRVVDALRDSVFRRS